MRALTATVVGNEPVVRSLLRLTLAAGPLASALPGQCVAVSRPSALSIVAHPFPLASPLVDGGIAVVVLHDAPTATALVPPALLPPAAEYHVATANGTAGMRGTALDLLPPLLPWADALYAALPAGAYLTLRDLVYRRRLRVRRGFATVVAEASLACYAAACAGCAVPLRDGYGLLCKDGPAFDLLELA